MLGTMSSGHVGYNTTMRTEVNKFTINATFDSARTVEAEWYETKGDFIDFITRNGSSPTGQDQALRIRADEVRTIELNKP